MTHVDDIKIFALVSLKIKKLKIKEKSLIHTYMEKRSNVVIVPVKTSVPLYVYICIYISIHLM